MSGEQRHLAVPSNVVIMKKETRQNSQLRRLEVEALARRVSQQIMSGAPPSLDEVFARDVVVGDDDATLNSIIEEIAEEERDYLEALSSIETLVEELMAAPDQIGEKVATIKNMLQPVLSLAGDTPALEVPAVEHTYESALATILHTTRVLYNVEAWDSEQIATGVKTIQQALRAVLARETA